MAEQAADKEGGVTAGSATSEPTRWTTRLLTGVKHHDNGAFIISGHKVRDLNTVFCQINVPPQIDAPPKFLDHVPEVSSSKIYMTTQFNDRLNAVLTICLLHSMK